jgi:hypothetical protein
MPVGTFGGMATYAHHVCAPHARPMLLISSHHSSSHLRGAHAIHEPGAQVVKGRQVVHELRPRRDASAAAAHCPVQLDLRSGRTARPGLMPAAHLLTPIRA